MKHFIITLFLLGSVNLWSQDLQDSILTVEIFNIQKQLEKQMIAKQSGGIGFGASLKEQDDKNHLQNTKPEDLIKYGLIPEFVGRFSMITSVSALTEEQLVKILTEPKNALIKQTQYLFGLDNIKIEFTDRTWGNRVCYLFYKVLKSFYISVWFYFAPFLTIVFSYEIPYMLRE